VSTALAAARETPPVDTCALAISQRVSSNGTSDLSSSGARTPHPGSDGDFVLAMRFATSSQFTFYSSYWTDDQLVDEADNDPYKDADGKFDSFVSASATQIRGCLPGGCKTYDLASLGHSATTLQDLFTNIPIGSSNNLKFGESTSDIRLWAEYAGRNGWTEETGWMDSGINYDDDRSGYQARVRFGAMFNNEGSVVTTNDAVGFGVRDAGSAEVGAGAGVWANQAYPMQGTIWVKADGWSSSSSAGASATGDPHLQNVHGERFDLMKPGRYVLINIPLGASVGDSLLRVEAEASKLGEYCGELYFQSLNITGSWADAKRTGGYRYKAQSDVHETPEWVAFGGVELKVAHGRTPDGARYLNIFAKHLKKAGHGIGGLLGEDDHSDVTVPSAACLQRVSLRASGGGASGPGKKVGSVAVASLA